MNIYRNSLNSHIMVMLSYLQLSNKAQAHIISSYLFLFC